MARLLLGIVIGVVTCATVIGTTMVIHAGADLARVVWCVAVLFAAAGAVAAGRRGAAARWRVVGVAIGGTAPIAILASTGIAFGSVAWAGSFIVVACAATAAGAIARGLGRRRAAVAIAVFALALVAATRWAVPRLVRSDAIVRMSRAVPELALATLDGAPLASSARRGRVTILAFWATWCEPCRAELPELRRLRARYATDLRVTFLAVNTGTEGDTPDLARAFVQRHGWDLPTAISPDGTAAAALGIHGLPAIALLDRAGRLRLVHRGYDRSESLADAIAAEVDQLLGE